MRSGFILLVAVFTCFDFVICSTFTPIVLWHGMGDACCFPFSLGAVQKRLNESMPGVHMLSIRIGSSVIDDLENSYLMHPNKQIDMACQMLKADPLFANGYNAIGFSQGSQFMRGLIQRCPYPKPKNFISLGGQHQGVYGLPNCISLSHPTCDYIRRLLNYAAYFSWLQHSLAQATYWHDPLNEKDYKKGSTFLADINNENYVNQSYITNLQALDNFVMVKFEKDSMVQPIESEWFGFYQPGQSVKVLTLHETDLYIQDRLGLQQMDNEDKLHFLSLPGDHLQFDWSWFEENIIEVYFKS